MSKQLPRNPHIDSLKKQARQLLKAYQSAQPEAAQRLRAYLPHLRTASDTAIFQAEFTLQSAQCILAREYGFSNWANLTEAVEIIRRADSDLLRQVDIVLQRDQSIHVLIPSYTVEEIAQRLAAHCGQEQVTLVPAKNRELNTWFPRLAAAPVVVSSPDELAFMTMHERLAKPEGPWGFEDLWAKAHAFVNRALRDEQSPLIISGPDEETGGSRDLISMYLTEFYALYGSMTDYRF